MKTNKGSQQPAQANKKPYRNQVCFYFLYFWYITVYWANAGQWKWPMKVNKGQQMPVQVYEKPMQAYEQPVQANDKLYDDRDGLNYLYIFNCY